MPGKPRERARRPADAELDDRDRDDFEDDLEEDRLEERAADEEADDREEPPRARPRERGLNAVTAGQIGLRHIATLTDRPTEGITRVEQPAGGGWLVDVELLEDRRVPSSGDILSLYVVELDDEGEVLSYRRLRRYRRGSGDDSAGGVPR